MKKTIKKAVKAASYLLTDKQCLSLRYFAAFHRPVNWKDPKTFNEKLQWLKLYDRKPIYNKMVDKHEVKQLVAGQIGKSYVVPELGVWDSFDQIDFEKLPRRFVLKTTHDCGGVVVCRDKEELVTATAEGWQLTPKGLQARKLLQRHLKVNYFYQSREWPYRDIPHRILAEEYLENPEGECLVVYKVFCFGGQPELIQVIQDDKTDRESIDYFDCDWNLLDLRQDFPNSVCHLPKPERLEEMLSLSAKLAGDRPFIRIDWYMPQGRLVFSEYTFYSDAGMAPFTPEDWDRKLGDKIILPK